MKKETWVTKDGTVKKIKNMTLKHLENVEKMLSKKISYMEDNKIPMISGFSPCSHYPTFINVFIKRDEIIKEIHERELHDIGGLEMIET